MNTIPPGGRAVAWAGFGFGSLVSILGNLQYTWIPKAPGGLSPEATRAWVAPEGWAPPVEAMIGAIVWPVMLLIAVEILSRVQWPSTWAWNLARFGGAGIVALGSAWISYGHLSEVLVHWDYGTGAFVGPIVIDGLMTISGFALLAQGRTIPAVDQADETTAPDETPIPAVDQGETESPPVPRKRVVPRPGLSDEQIVVMARTRLSDPSAPPLSRNWVMKEFGAGTKRAGRLVDEARRLHLAA